jgi:hypothetical protein
MIAPVIIAAQGEIRKAMSEAGSSGTKSLPKGCFGPGASVAVEVPETSLGAPPGHRFEPDPPVRSDAANGG